MKRTTVGQMTTVHPHFDEGSVYNLVTRFTASAITGFTARKTAVPTS
jgi:hypothetical protein